MYRGTCTFSRIMHAIRIMLIMHVMPSSRTDEGLRVASAQAAGPQAAQTRGQAKDWGRVGSRWHYHPFSLTVEPAIMRAHRTRSLGAGSTIARQPCHWPPFPLCVQSKMAPLCRYWSSWSSSIRWRIFSTWRACITHDGHGDDYVYAWLSGSERRRGQHPTRTFGCECVTRRCLGWLRMDFATTFDFKKRLYVCASDVVLELLYCCYDSNTVEN